MEFMTDAQQIFAALLLSGIVMIAVEVFVPGGILGVLGALALLGAIVTGFVAFPSYGPVVAVGILVFSAITLIAWLKIAPQTWIGRKLTISRNLDDAHAVNPGLETLIGQKGVTLCALRPSGFARIAGKKIDVVTQGEMIEKGEQIRVVEVESNRVIVKQA